MDLVRRVELIEELTNDLVAHMASVAHAKALARVVIALVSLRVLVGDTGKEV